MKLLLDTHTFIWWSSEPQKLSAAVLTQLQARNNIILLSVASIWEIQIKHSLGKLTLQEPLEDMVSHHMNVEGFNVLEVSWPYIVELGKLPMIHRDPWDRITRICDSASTESAPRSTRYARYVSNTPALRWTATGCIVTHERYAS